MNYIYIYIYIYYNKLSIKLINKVQSTIFNFCKICIICKLIICTNEENGEYKNCK